MENKKKFSPKALIAAVLAVALVIGAVIAAILLIPKGLKINEVPPTDQYAYINPDESKAETDAGIVIDGVLDEAVYQNNNWLYLHNDDGGNNVDIAMTSYYGEKGMYFVYDVTETVPIYVNLQRASYMNSCIEMYFAPSTVTSLKENSYFEVDMLPTGDMVFKKSNGKGGYVNVATTDDVMAYLGATTKGGEVNTDNCYGYNLELFIPWAYMDWLGLDADGMKQSFVYVDPAHITSNNLTGTDTNVDRYWYFYAQQQGAGFGDIYQYFRFDGSGAMGTVPVTLTGDNHCTLTGDRNVIPGMQTTVTITPERGYAINSVVVNGEEMIEKVSFNADGSVNLTTRGQKNGLTVTAAAEAVTAGNKTLKGTITLAKPGGDSLDGVQMFYSGASGDKPLNFDAEGHFEIADAAQGYYIIKAEKEGYTALSQGVYLNRDTTVSLILQYNTFYSERGTCWLLDQQNSGILQKFGGSGYLLSTDSYNKFTFSANFFYDEALPQEANTDYFQQQRSGMRILFSNGKYWHIDMLKENGKYIVQYAKHSGDGSVFGWKGICELTDAQIARYTSDEGIKLTVQRDGQYAALWLDDSLIAVEKLDSEYASCTAQLGFESWVANRTVQDIPYSISPSNSVNLRNAAFQKEGKWDISGMFQSYLTSPASTGDTGWIWTYDTGYRDVTVNVTDKNPEANDFKMAIHFKFSNGEEFRISLTNADTGALGTYKIQVLDQNTIVKNWRTHYVLSESEIAKLTGKDGLDFRVAIVGSSANVYLDNVQVCALDLSKDLEGNETGIAKAYAKIGLRLYGNEGYSSGVSYDLGGTVKTSAIQTVDGSQVTVNGSNHVIGETVVLTPPDGGCEFVSVTVDGKAADLTDKESYSFIATSDSHTVEAVSVRVRDWNPKENAGHTWELSQQTAGILGINAETTDTNWVWTYGDSYRDISLTVSDGTPDANNFRAGIHFEFTDGNVFRVSLTNADEGALGTYKIQLMGANTIAKNWTTAYILTQEEVTKLQAEGVAFRVVILGESVNMYIDGKLAASYGLPGIGDAAAKIAVRYYGGGAAQTVSYTLGGEPEWFALNIAQCENGTVTSKASCYLPGDTATVYVKGDNGYAYDELLVGGVSVITEADGSYSFAADPAVTVQATFSEVIFMDFNGNAWNVSNQNKGFLFIPATSNGAGWMQTKDSFNELSLIFKDYAEGTVHEYAVVAQLYFENNKFVSIRFIYDKNTGKYNLQSMNDSVFKWRVHYTLTEAQAAKVQGEGVEFRMTRSGTKLSLFLDGFRVSQLDLTGDSSGITEDMTCVVKLRYYNNLGYDVVLPFAVDNPLPSGTVTVETAENGSLTADKTEYVIGEPVTLTVKPNSGYAYESLTVNGERVSVGKDGTYTFLTAEESYTAAATFAEATFVDFQNNPWNLIHQNQGVLYIPASSNGAGWMQTKDNYNELTLTVKDYAAGTVHEYAVVGQLYFENEKYASIRLIYNKNDGKYTLQSMGDSVANWVIHHTLTDAQAAKVQGDGIVFKLSRVGTSLNLYLDEVLVKTVDLTGRSSGITADMTCVAKVRYYNSAGFDVTLPFSLGNPGQEASVTVAGSSNGTVTANKTTCSIGDTVKLTVTPADGYACKELKLNGKTVALNWDSTCSFTATEASYTVSAIFDKVAFTRNSSNFWNLTKQLLGMLRVNSHASGNSGWIDSAENTNDVTTVVKDHTPDAKNFSMIYHFTFSNGETFRLRMNHTDSDGVYRIQSMSSSTLFAAWKSRHDFTAEQTAKIKGDGIAFRVVILDTTAYVYLDDVQVCTYDLTSTGKGSGLADCTVKVALRMDGNLNTDVPVAYTLQETKELPQ